MVTITGIDPNFSIGVGASLLAWVISSTITGFIGYFITNIIIKRRYEKKLSESISGTTKAIQNININVLPENDAAVIIKEFNIHIDNYSSIKKVIKNDQIERIKFLLEQSPPDKNKIKAELRDLKKTWKSSLKAMYEAQDTLNKELGLKK